MDIHTHTHIWGLTTGHWITKQGLIPGETNSPSLSSHQLPVTLYPGQSLQRCPPPTLALVLSFKCCLGYCNQYIYAFLHLNRAMPQDIVPLETGGGIFRRNNFENNYSKQVHFKSMEMFLHILSHCRTIYILKNLLFLFKFCVASKSPRSFVEILISETERKRKITPENLFSQGYWSFYGKCIPRILILDSQVLFLDQ